MKILVIEDEAKARDYMRKGLTEAGFIVDVAEMDRMACSTRRSIITI